MRRCWRKTLASPSIATLLFASAVFSVAGVHAVVPGNPPERTSGADRGQWLFLEVLVNQVPLQGLVRMRVLGNQVWADHSTVVELGLKADAIPPALWQQDLVRLDQVPHVELNYDAPKQQLKLQAPIDMLDRNITHAPRTRRLPANVQDGVESTGLLLNYDLYLQRSSGSANPTTNLSAWTEWRAFHPLGVFSHTMLSQWSDRQAAPGGQPMHLRLDTTWRSDFPDKAMSVVIGDTVTSALPWSRPVRIGGIRVGTDFDLQPYRPTRPLTAVQAQAMLPSTVDLYVDGLLQEQLQVLPGTFTIESLTTVNGAGMAQLVITDITGERRTLDVPIYGTVELLRQGLVDWSAEFGALRQRYGRESFAYGSDPVASSSWRYGLYDTTTLEGHAQWGAGTRVVGFGALQRLGMQGGIFSASLASSDTTGAPSGHQASAGFQWDARPWRFSVRSQRTSPHFRDLASTEGALMTRSSDRAFFGFSHSGWDLGATALRQRDSRGQAISLASLSLGRQLSGGLRWTVGLSETRAVKKEQRLGVSFSMPLDRSLSVAASVQQQGDELSGAWQASKSARQDDEWSWRVAQTAPKGSSHLNASRNTPYGLWAGSIDRFNATGSAGASTSLSTSFGGAVAFMDRRLFMSRRIDDAFALVSTPGMEGISVKLENQPIGKTDAQGHLFVSRLNANQRNQLSVDLIDLDYDVSAGSTTLHAVPRRYSGMRVDFAFQRVVFMRATLRDVQQRPIPTGSGMALEGEPPATTDKTPAMAFFPRVGHDGEILIENPVPGTVLKIETTGGDTCRFRLPDATPNATGQINLGDMPCT